MTYTFLCHLKVNHYHADEKKHLGDFLYMSPYGFLLCTLGWHIYIADQMMFTFNFNSSYIMEVVTLTIYNHMEQRNTPFHAITTD